MRLVDRLMGGKRPMTADEFDDALVTIAQDEERLLLDDLAAAGIDYEREVVLPSYALPASSSGASGRKRLPTTGST